MLLNLLYQTTRDLSLEELRFARSPLLLLYNHLSTPQMAKARFLAETKSLEMESTRASDSDEEEGLEI